MKNHKSQITNHKLGFTVLEILVGVAIMGIAVTIVALSFSKVNSEQALDKSADLVVSVLNEARSLTLSSRDASQYGIYFEESQATLFKGATYSSGATGNVVTPLSSLIGLRNITLLGGGTSVVFKRLTGETLQSGSLEVYLKSEPTNFRTITINTTGISEEN